MNSKVVVMDTKILVHVFCEHALHVHGAAIFENKEAQFLDKTNFNKQVPKNAFEGVPQIEFDFKVRRALVWFRGEPLMGVSSYGAYKETNDLNIAQWIPFLGTFEETEEALRKIYKENGIDGSLLMFVRVGQVC